MKDGTPKQTVHPLGPQGWVKDGSPSRAEDGRINTSGTLGAIGINNVYLTTYAIYPDERRPDDLEVGASISGVEFRLSGEKGSYDVYRVQ